MKVNFPDNCNAEASRWSFCIKLNENLRLWHNANCTGMTASEAELWRKAHFYKHLDAVMVARNEQIAIARVGDHWNPKIPDHVSGGVLNYPSGLNQDNEGSRAAFLFGLEYKLKDKDMDDPDIAVIREAISQAKEDAINGSYWNPTLEDIING